MITVKKLKNTLLDKFSLNINGLAISDRHFDIERMNQIIDALPHLKALGLSHFFIEIPNNFEAALNHFYEGNDDALLSFYQKAVQFHKMSLPKQDEDPLKVAMKLHTTLRQYNVSVIAIDTEGPEEEENPYPLDSIENLNKHFEHIVQQTLKDTSFRNQHWAKTIQDTIRDTPDARYLIFGGGLHFHTLNMKDEAHARSVTTSLGIERIRFIEDASSIQRRLVDGYIL